MTGYQVFKMCQGFIGRKYRGDKESFEQLSCSSYYYSVADYLEHTFGKSKYIHSKFLKVCGKQFGSNFNPFNLMTDEYMEAYKKWSSIHESDESYKNNIKECIQYIYNFCRDKDIKSIRDYTKRWSVSHIVSDILEENVAYVIGVHKLYLTKPEKKLIKKKYLDNVEVIKERLERDNEISEFILNNLKVAEEKISNS